MIDAAEAAVLKAAIHDLKGPASRLRLLSELLRREPSDLALIGHIEESAGSVDRVAGHLRRYFEICSRALNIQPASLALPLEAAIAATGAHVAYTWLPRVEADEFLMTHVFRELIQNALDANATSIAVSGDDGRISILDNGRGIEPGMEEMIFRPFRPGVGLAICRTIIESHGCRIWAEPRAGGAEIRFTLRSPSPDF